MARRITRIAAIAMLAGCTGQPSTAPTLTPEAAAGSIVRFREPRVDWREGRLLASRDGASRIVTTGGDTTLVPCGAEVEALVPGAGTATWRGALIGSLLGGAIVEATCNGQKYCGEENPIPFLTMLAGYFIGRNQRVSAFRPARVPGCRADQPA